MESNDLQRGKLRNACMSPTAVPSVAGNIVTTSQGASSQEQAKVNSPSLRLQSTNTEIKSRRQRFAQAVARATAFDFDADSSQVGSCLFTKRFEGLMSVLICFNLIIIVIETDERAMCYPEFKQNLSECPHNYNHRIWIINVILLVMFTLEAILKVFVLRMLFIQSLWNWLDVFIVLTGWLSEVLPAGMSIIDPATFRALRIVRLSRVMRILGEFQELPMLCGGLVSAMRAIFFGAVMLALALLLFSIVVVQFVHPVNSSIEYVGCERCSKGFESVMMSTLTLFQQNVAGDSWGLISIPVILEAPWAALLLCGILITVSLGIMNLILAVIVERAAEARERNVEQRLKEKLAAQKELGHELSEMIQQMDTHGVGHVSRAQLVEAYGTHTSFATMMKLMDIRKDDLEEIVDGLDNDNSGTVDYREFCSGLHRISSSDTRIMLGLIKAGIAKLDAKVTQRTELQTELLRSVGARLDRLLLAHAGDGGSSAGGDTSYSCGACAGGTGAASGGRGGADDEVGSPKRRVNHVPQPMLPEPSSNDGVEVDHEEGSGGRPVLLMPKHAENTKFLEDFSSSKGDLLLIRVDEQAAMLRKHIARIASSLRHAPLVASSNDVVLAPEDGSGASPSGRCGGDVCNAVATSGPLLGHGAHRGREHSAHPVVSMQLLLGRLLCDVERRLDNEAAALASSGRLLELINDAFPALPQSSVARLPHAAAFHRPADARIPSTGVTRGRRARAAPPLPLAGAG